MEGVSGCWEGWAGVVNGLGLLCLCGFVGLEYSEISIEIVVVVDVVFLGLYFLHQSIQIHHQETTPGSILGRT